MPAAHPIQPSFAAGEVSPRLFGRVDLTKYAIGLETCENFIVMPHGGVRKRGGTRFIAEVKDSAASPRLVPFVFSTAQAYILEFGDGSIRFFMDLGQIFDGGAPYEIASPYALADLDALRFAQSADTLFIVHPNHAPRQLTRTGHTSWTLSEAACKNGPFRPLNPDPALKIAASAATGTATLTASAPLFEAGHVGALFRLYEASNSFPYSPLYFDASVALNGVRTANGHAYRLVAIGGPLSEWSSQGAPSHTKGVVRMYEQSNIGTYIDFKYMHSGFGIVKILSVDSPTSAQAEVQGDAELPESVASAEGTEYWQEGAWSTLRGFPSAATFFEQRLWFAATPSDPQTLWGSKTNAYLDFADGVLDADALSYAIASAQVDAISWLAAGKILHVGTDSGEYVMSASAQNEAVTPTNIRVTSGTRYGSSAAQPVQVSNAVLFAQRHGTRGAASRRLRELVYTFESDGYIAPDLTIVSEHIARAGLVELAYQPAPDSIVWGVRGDGRLVGLTYEREQQVVAWHRHVIGGISDADGTPADVERVAVIPGADGDELWLVVRRWINGETRRFVEVLSEGLDDASAQADATFADCFLTYSGPPAATLSGLDHLEGETVAILGDGAVHPPRTVVGGMVSVSPAVSRACIGLPYAATLKTLRLEAGAAVGTAQGRKKRISQVRVRVHRSLGGAVGAEAGALDLIPTRSAADPMGAPPPLFSGDLTVDLDGGWVEDGQIVIRHDQPLPMNVLAVMPEVRTSG